MSVQKWTRGGRTRWETRWLEDGRHRSRVFERKSDALEFEADQRRRLRLGAHTPAEPSAERLAAWLRRWWARDADGWARSTRIARASLLDKWITPYIGPVRLRDLGPARVREWRAQITATGAPANTANAALAVLSAVLGAATRDGLIPANPCVGIRKLPHAVARPRALTPLEVERIRVEMPTARDVVLLDLLAYAGLRPEEALALRWGDVGDVLIIDRAWTADELKASKTGARRTVKVVPPLADDLAILRPHLADPDALVCPSETGGFLNLNNWRRRIWGPAVIAAGLSREVRKGNQTVKQPTASPGDGRHTYASLLIHEGRSPLLVSAALGHASGELVWRRYAHVFEQARLASGVSMVDAICSARAELRRAGLRPDCDTGQVRQLRAVPPSA